MYRDPLTDHPDTKRVPLADWIVRYHCGLAWVFLVVIETAGADLVLVRVPNLHLRRAAQIDTAVTARVDNLPVDQ